MQLQEFDGTSSVSQLSDEAALLVPAEELPRAHTARCALRRPQGRGADRGGGRREARAADLQQARRTGSQCAVPAVL